MKVDQKAEKNPCVVSLTVKADADEIKGAVARSVAIPPGTWRADDGTCHVGPRTVEVATPLSRLPHFERIE